MRVKLSRRADNAVKRIDAWWRANADHPGVFLDQRRGHRGAEARLGGLAAEARRFESRSISSPAESRTVLERIQIRTEHEEDASVRPRQFNPPTRPSTKTYRVP